MKFGSVIIFGLVMVYTAGIMIGIGVAQLKSRKPVGFYSGEKALKAEELTSVQDWNKKHGIMWILYGITMSITSVITAMMLESTWCMVPFGCGVILPLPIMIFYHHYLIRKYKIK